MISLALCAVVSTSHAAAPQAWVVLSRRTGITSPKAMAVATEVASKLQGVPMAAALEDLSSCKAKRVCLVEAARKKHAAVLVTVEVGAVLDDATLRVEGLSIDEDGKSLGVIEADSPLAGLVAKAEPKLAGEFSTTLRTTLGLTPPPQPKVEPPPVVPMVTAPPPEPKPEVVPAPVTPVVVAEAKPFFTPGRIAGVAVAGAGAAALVVGGVFGAQASAGAAKVKMLCPDAQCTNPEAFTTYNQAAQSQNLGVALSVAGGVALAAGAVVFLINPGGEAPAASAVVVPVQGGVMSSFSMSF
ncbi:MAG: hypothetical protein ABTQ32_38065 [Myxococcaceae bacterium]